MGPGALKKDRRALRKERDRMFKDYASGAEKLDKAVRNYYQLRGKGDARRLVSLQEDFRSLDRILQPTCIPEITGVAPAQARCFAIQVLPPSPRGPQVASGPSAAKGRKRKAGAPIHSSSVSLLAKRVKLEVGGGLGTPPTRDVLKYVCTIVDPANSGHIYIYIYIYMPHIDQIRIHKTKTNGCHGSCRAPASAKQN